MRGVGGLLVFISDYWARGERRGELCGLRSAARNVQLWSHQRSPPSTWEVGRPVLILNNLITSLGLTRAQPSPGHHISFMFPELEFIKSWIKHISRRRGVRENTNQIWFLLFVQSARQWTLLSREFKSFDDKRFYELKFERLKFAEGFLEIQIVSNDKVSMYVVINETMIKLIKN